MVEKLETYIKFIFKEKEPLWFILIFNEKSNKFRLCPLLSIISNINNDFFEFNESDFELFLNEGIRFDTLEKLDNNIFFKIIYCEDLYNSLNLNLYNVKIKNNE